MIEPGGGFSDQLCTRHNCRKVLQTPDVPRMPLRFLPVKLSYPKTVCGGCEKRVELFILKVGLKAIREFGGKGMWTVELRQVVSQAMGRTVHPKDLAKAMRATIEPRSLRRGKEVQRGYCLTDLDKGLDTPEAV